MKDVTAEYVSGFTGCCGCQERTRRLWLVLVMGTISDGAAIDSIAADADPNNGALRFGNREAASRLGVAEAAVRKRVQRGSLGKEMGFDGRVYVYLDLSRPESQEHRDPVVEELRKRVASLERSLERRSLEAERYQQIVAGLTQTNNQLSARVLELEAGPITDTLSDERGGRSGACGGLGGPHTLPRPAGEGPQEGAQRPWWRRVFGGGS